MIYILYRVLSKEVQPSQKYQDFVRSRLAEVEDEQSYLFYGAMSEIGELADLIAKSMRPGRVLDKDKFLDECGDVLFYLTFLEDVSLIRDMLFALWDFGDVFLLGLEELEQINMNKLNKRERETGSHLK